MPERKSMSEDLKAEFVPRSSAGTLFFVLFGSVFALAGLFALTFLLPDAIRKGDGEGIVVGAVLGCLFTAIGCGIIALGLWSGRQLRFENRSRMRHPDAPWMWKREWAERRVKGSTRLAMIFLWCFATVWNAISWPIVPKIIESIGSGEKGALFGLLFPVVGLGLLGAAVHSTLRARRFGSTFFLLDTLPGVIGGELSGRVQLARPLPLGATLRVRLVCVHSVRTGSGEHATTTEHVMYEEKRELDTALIQRGAFGAELPLSFVVPYALPSSRDEDPRDTIRWRIELACALPGVDYGTQFDVPVFETSESSPDVREPMPDPGALDRALEGRGPLSESRVRIRRRPDGGVELYFGRARNPGTAIFLTVFSLFWGGVVYFLHSLDDAPMLIFAGFALVELCLVIATLHLWLSATTAVADHSGLHVRSGLPGLSKRRFLPSETITDLRCEQGMRSGSRVFYRIRAMQGGHGTTAGWGIPERAEARALIGLLARGLGREEPAP